MASKLHQNAVLTGCIDSFCLACESHLRSEQDAFSHIEKPVHIKNLKSAGYLEKHAFDRIRKIKKGYYCEFCNILLPTAAKVGLHVMEQTHNDNKGSQLIMRFGNNVILGDNILISEQAWNGLIMETCAICNVEFRNRKLHITDQKHILNLVQKKVVFGDHNIVYRKIDDTSFHCLICNTIGALNAVSTHYQDDDHETHFNQCQKLYQSQFKNNNHQEKNVIEDDKDTSVHHQNNELNNEDQNENGIDNAKDAVSVHHHNNGDKNKRDLKENCIDDAKDAVGNHQNNEFKKNKGQKKNDINNAKDPSVHHQNNNAFKNNLNSKNTFQVNNVEKVPEELKQIPVVVNGLKSDDNNNKIDANNSKEKAAGNSISVQKEKKSAGFQTEFEKAVLVNKDVQKTNKTKKMPNMEMKDKDVLFEHVPEFQKNGVTINFETETAFCKKCFEDVDLDIDKLKQHINDHKNNSATKATANTAHTMNQNHSRTVLNSKNKDDLTPHTNSASKPITKFDQNHKDTKSLPKKKDTQEEEIIKLDLRKNAEEEIDKTETNNAISVYVPKLGTSAAEPPKPKATAEEPAKMKNLDMNDPETFAKHNNITYNKGVGNAYCRICSARIPAAIKNMKEHVNGMSHKGKIARIAEKERAGKYVPKKPMGKFIHQHSSVMNVFGVDDVILNDKYCMTRMSFFMITTQNRLRCQACEVTLHEDDVSRHVDGVFHERAMTRTPVVTSLTSEFVREVRPNLYHCGYCNLIAGSWEDLQRHLQCGEHTASAAASQRRLQEHLPGILEHRQSRDRLMIHTLLERFWPFF